MWPTPYSPWCYVFLDVQYRRQTGSIHCKCWELETEKKSSNELLVYILKIINIVQWMICPFQLRDCYFLEIFYNITPVIYQQMDGKKLETNPKENQRF